MASLVDKVYILVTKAKVFTVYLICIVFGLNNSVSTMPSLFWSSWILHQQYSNLLFPHNFVELITVGPTSFAPHSFVEHHNMWCTRPAVNPLTSRRLSVMAESDARIASAGTTIVATLDVRTANAEDDHHGRTRCHQGRLPWLLPPRGQGLAWWSSRFFADRSAAHGQPTTDALVLCFHWYLVSKIIFFAVIILFLACFLNGAWPVFVRMPLWAMCKWLNGSPEAEQFFNEVRFSPTMQWKMAKINRVRLAG